MIAGGRRLRTCGDMLSREVMADALLEVVEGPDAGLQLLLDRPVIIGRAEDADVVLADNQVSSHHARVTPATGGCALVEDLESTNGTFINDSELYSPARLELGDLLLVGVTLLELRSVAETLRRPSAVRSVPPALATATRDPSYVNAAVVEPERSHGSESRVPKLEKYLDVHVRRRAQLAPVALFVLIALALMIYFATR